MARPKVSIRAGMLMWLPGVRVRPNEVEHGFIKVLGCGEGQTFDVDGTFFSLHFVILSGNTTLYLINNPFTLPYHASVLYSVTT